MRISPPIVVLAVTAAMVAAAVWIAPVPSASPQTSATSPTGTSSMPSATE